ncbi:MAG: pteridine-dependent deoxygenase like protein [Acidobacteriota bacterium]
MIQPLSSPSALPAPRCAEDPGLRPPAWVDGLCRTGGHGLASVRIPEARGLGRAAFQETTTRAYEQIRSELVSRGAVHPVRLWNHIPGIHEPMGDGLDRYMVFNAGRYEALSEWFGGDQAFDTRVASASGVGHQGRDLVIHCLASERPGRAVDNPRQTAPYRYSRKYGPLPPCFARATRIEAGGRPLVLVGGTASIVGEESVHLGDLARQTEETLANLAALAPLAGYRELRVYYPDPEKLGELRELLEGAFPRAGRIEWMRADLCRSELLVEIEGLAAP